MNDFWQERKNIERDMPIADATPPSWSPSYQQKMLLQLLKTIRAELKPGYTAGAWSPTVICITYYPAGPDSRQRHFVRHADEWAALKVKLGL
jgi:hypothetical protein